MAIPVLLVVATITFALLHLTPGDPAAVLLGDQATPEDIARIRQKLGLERPIYIQYGLWLIRVFQGDLGESLFLNRSVVRAIGERLEPTLSLAILAELIAVSLAIPLGVLAAWKANTWVDRTVMVFAVLGFSIPVFWLGLNFIFLFSVKLRLLPVAGYQPLAEGFLPFLRYLILPAVTLGLIHAALIARMTRSSMLEVLREDYIKTARAKGLSETLVLMRHAFRSASVPVVTIIGLSFAGLVTGVVVTETVFSIPGVGRLIVSAVLTRDYPLIQGVILLVACAYVFINLAVDLLYVYLDPRIRY
jgi:peptide/nickel transport system permease protein